MTKVTDLETKIVDRRRTLMTARPDFLTAERGGVVRLVR